MHSKVKNQIDKINSVVSSITTIETLLAGTANHVELNVAEQAKTGQKQLSELTELARDIRNSLGILANAERLSDLRRLSACGEQYFSAHDEDGIISEIFRRIGTSNKFFVEIGAGDGRENNSLYLLLQNWNGFWLEANPQAVASSLSLWKEYVLNHSLQIAKAQINQANIAGILSDLRVPENPDFLSLSVFDSSYHLLDGCLKAIKPSVISIKYDTNLGPQVALVGNKQTGKTEADTRIGTSLKAIEMLGKAYGYSLVGCSTFGGSAFLVKSEMLGNKFSGPFTSETLFEPLRPRQKPLKPAGYLEAVCTSENLLSSDKGSVTQGFMPSLYCEGVENNVFISPADQVIGRGILLNAEWEPFIAQLIKQIVKPGDIVFDIGANIGCHAVSAGKQVGPKGQVLAIEPEPHNFELLNRNLQINECSNQVATFRMALSDRNGEIFMGLSDWNMGDHRICLDTSNSKSSTTNGEPERKLIPLKSMTLDDFAAKELKPELSQNPIKLIKIDTQGAEVCIFRQGQKTLQRTQVLISEYWPYGLKQLGCDAQEFWKLLDGHFTSGAVIATAGQELMGEIKPLPFSELKAVLLSELDYSPHSEYDIILYK